MEHPNNPNPLTLLDGGTSRRAYRMRLQEGVVGCITARPRGAKRKPTERMRDVAEGRWHKRNPLGPIERLIADACRVRDTVPAADLPRYDMEHLYGKVQGAVAQAVAAGIDASNARRAAEKRGGAA